MGTRTGGARPHGQPGFSLIELMIVLLLAGAILAIGAPSFADFMRNNRLTAAANDFLAVAHAARNEAIKRQSPVSLCSSSSPTSAAAQCNAGDFIGWIAFDDRDGNCTRDAGEAVLRTGGPLNTGIANRSDGGCLSYAASGFPRTSAAPLTRLVFCDSRGLDLQAGTSLSAARGIQISVSGRPQLLRDPATLGGWELACSTR